MTGTVGFHSAYLRAYRAAPSSPNVMTCTQSHDKDYEQEWNFDCLLHTRTLDVYTRLYVRIYICIYVHLRWLVHWKRKWQWMRCIADWLLPYRNKSKVRDQVKGSNRSWLQNSAEAGLLRWDDHICLQGRARAGLLQWQDWIYLQDGTTAGVLLWQDRIWLQDHARSGLLRCRTGTSYGVVPGQDCFAGWIGARARSQLVQNRSGGRMRSMIATGSGSRIRTLAGAGRWQRRIPLTSDQGPGSEPTI